MGYVPQLQNLSQFPIMPYVRTSLLHTPRFVQPFPRPSTPPRTKRSWMLQAAQRWPRRLQTITSVICAQYEPALIDVENGMPTVNLPILRFSGTCQQSCMVKGCTHKSHERTSGTPQQPHASSLLQVVLGKALPVILFLLTQWNLVLGHCFSHVSPPHLKDVLGDPTNLLVMACLNVPFAQIPSYATSRDKGTSRMINQRRNMAKCCCFQLVRNRRN